MLLPVLLQFMAVLPLDHLGACFEAATGDGQPQLAVSVPQYVIIVGEPDTQSTGAKHSPVVATSLVAPLKALTQRSGSRFELADAAPGDEAATSVAASTQVFSL
ncbi:hypothetical protein GCM10022224_017610 [Nonomuraea antimicrobica]|uniref:Secreted protein n=1 Tax=Nonomuraea antimicrobica TaxID=561173 RepID=A0ABP7BD67_9ACTN